MKRGIGFKISIFFVMVIGVGVLSTLFLFHFITSDFVTKSIKEKLQDAVFATRVSMDFQELVKVDSNSMRMPAYLANWKKLKKIQTSLGVTDLYIMITNPKGTLTFIYDTSDNPDIREVTGGTGARKVFIDRVTGTTLSEKSVGDEEDLFLEEYRKPPKEISQIMQSRSERPYYTDIYTDEFGTFRSVFLPVLNSKDKTYCVIGADFDVNAIFRLIGKMVLIAVLNVLILLSICIVFIRYFRGKVVKPIEDLNKAVRLAANKVWDYQIFLNNRDEIGELAKNFNLMSMNLKDNFEKIEEYNRSLSNQLYVDRLTGLPNRKQFFDDLEKFSNPVVIMINIDSFHEINDFYGSETGDFILVEMARRLKSLCLGSYYHLYKMSADQYSIVVDEEMGKPGMEILGIYFSEGVMDYPFVFKKETEIFVSISLGIGKMGKTGVTDNDPKNYRMALANADRALKQARLLRKKFMVFDETVESRKEYQNNIEWSRKIKKAIRDDRIIPYFQPIINNRNGKIEKYECLVRLVDEDGKIILPYYFLDIAKTARLYRYITKIMIDKTFEFFSKNDFEFSVNLSVEDIMDEKTVAYILGKLNEYGDIGKRLVFEFLETENIEEYAEVKQFVEKVRSKGCRIAIDDFGTGYSNFSHIVHLNVDYIKIDSSLIKNINNDRNSLIITKTIANFARELGMKTISEFVHSKEVFDECVKLEIDFSQGYFLGEPKSFLVEELKK